MTRPLSYYEGMNPDRLRELITKTRQQLGTKVVILCHHYQLDEIVEHADFLGDSYLLAQKALQCSSGEYIVFCGVRFMAETADVITPSTRRVLLPAENAGCPMADMATYDDVQVCWEELLKRGIRPVPVAYMNSSASIKAFCGDNGGAVCTSSNARDVLRWSLEKGDCVLFLPDEHLGRNTGHQLGIPSSQVALWRRQARRLEGEARPRLVVWDGYCSVHQQFTSEQVNHVRTSSPQAKVIVHPECSQEVVNASDYAGSTEFIIRQVSESPPGSIFAIGTEINLVSRLAARYPDRTITSLNPQGSSCRDMGLLKATHLCRVLESLCKGEIINEVRVDESVAGAARRAIERMIEVSG